MTRIRYKRIKKHYKRIKHNTKNLKKKKNYLHRSMYLAAYDPDLIHVGIVQQNLEGDVDCLEKYCEEMTKQNKKCWRENISVIRMSATETRGVVPSRFLVSTLFEGEEFFMQIDSHTIFISDW